MKTIMAMAQQKAEELRQMITRMDIQYNFRMGEYAACVWYTDGSEWLINDSGACVNRKEGI